MNTMHYLFVRILQVLMEIMMCFYAGKLEGLMVGGRDELLLLSNKDGRTLNFVVFCHQ